MKLSDCAEGFLLARSTSVSPSTMRMDRDVIRAFVGWRGDCEAQEVTADDLRCFIMGRMDHGLAKASARRYFVSLSACRLTPMLVAAAATVGAIVT